VRRVLVANRGEIAVRIVRACRELDLQTVAVYSDVDRDALHVRLADDSVAIGSADPQESYQHIGRLIDAARSHGADAVHPGYGFLAENPAFAAAVRDAGLTFIGPPAEVIASLGDKVAARRLMAGAGVPVVPGYDEAGASDDALVAAAGRLGVPLLLKAAGGGGGRGMRLVERQADLRPLLAQARREALAAFGSEDVFLERYLPEVRHIEIQVLADTTGAIVILGERECSVQRRHQKLIEEAPSPFATPDLRAALSQAAATAAHTAGYVNAGSVEFLVEPSGQFYFLEVNTRLQVEHGVTEWVTGVDLVKSQLRIASGKRLAPDSIELRGHAVECRVYAEDPSRDYAPSPGPILVLVEPAGPGIRVDSGLCTGWEVPTAYDPLLAKVIAWDRTRADAIARMTEALRRYVILGCGTNLQFLQDIVRHEAFSRGDTTTTFLERHFAGWQPDVPTVALAAAAVAPALEDMPSRTPQAAGDGGPSGSAQSDPWGQLGPWRLGTRHG
jgi:acetyl-CoA carboxylase biotin carboxylase subunit